ncbi:MAG: DUF2309 domain-containing protein [Actinomycetota bacterium]|nr:DUF2309 domain-containing protein [Actinomycetota bacterium]
MSRDDRGAARARLLGQVDEAARVVAPLWPLSTFVAVNPLWDLRQMPFHEAVAHAGRTLGIAGYPSSAMFVQAYADKRVTAAELRAALDDEHAPERATRTGAEHADGRGGRRPRASTAAERHDRVFGTNVAEAVDRHVAKWCAAYVAGVVPDDGARGFYAAWRQVVVYDPAARSVAGRAGRKRLAELGADAEAAILGCLDLLGIPEAARTSELARHLGRMPGWAGHAKWRSRWAAPQEPGPALHLVDYLAVRLCYEAVFLSSSSSLASSLARKPGLGNQGRRAPRGGSKMAVRGPTGVGAAGMPEDVTARLSCLDATRAARVWLAAYEHHYRDRLLAALAALAAPGAPDQEPVTPEVRHPAAQAVFCIDTRSEPLRRHLEAAGPYETLGFAGFFALPIRYRAWGSAETVDLCPALVRPTSEMVERPAGGARGSAGRALAGRQVLAGARGAFGSARKGAASQFVLAEAAGFVAGPIAIAKTLAPGRYKAARSWAQRVLVPPSDTVVDADPQFDAMGDEEQALYAQTALTTMGLTRSFASVVLLCGHGSTTENNPYASSLDCGACGGNRGGPSARAAAAILNRPTTRRLLAERGIVVPDGTVFVAGEHDTATDTVGILDAHLVPSTHRDAVAELQSALEHAGAAAAAERRRFLPAGGSRARTRLPAERAADWAQVRPEWGLARNAAFVVGPRELTAGLDLEGRCFLHSYDPQVDADGAALETILTAPMVVAHWINAQYYFSTVDPAVLSAGDKTAHNVVAGIGVVLGEGGDLRVGLPLQSLYDAERAYHEPMRLLVVVHAPLARLDAVIARNPVLRELFDGQWVHLAQREDRSDCWRIRRTDGTWARWSPAEPRAMASAGHG